MSQENLEIVRDLYEAWNRTGGVIARGRASGVVVDAPGWHVWTVRRSKVMRWLIFGTRRDAFEAAGLSE